MLLEGVRMADVSKGRQPQQSRKAGGTTTTTTTTPPPPPHEKCSSVGERLHSRVHVCNHARCAANDPDYNVKSAVPPKKFLVARKHAYGGLEAKGEKKRGTTSGSSTTTTTTATTASPDDQRSRIRALKALTNSVLATESGSNGKARSNGSRSNAPSVVQSRRATRENSSISSDYMKAVERKVRPRSSDRSSGRSGVTTAESHSTAQKSRLSSAGSIFSTLAAERSKRWDSASPESAITSIKITQIISTRRVDRKEEEGEDETHKLVAAAVPSSPTASVGSNHDVEISSLKGAVAVGEEVGAFEQPNANVGDLQSHVGSFSKVLERNAGTREHSSDSPSPSSPSADNRPPLSELLTPSTPSTSFAPTTSLRSSLTTPPASELSSSSLLKADVGQEEINSGSSSPSLDSTTPSTSGSLISAVTSLKSGSRLSPGLTVRSSLTTTSVSSSDKLARKPLSNLKEGPTVGSPLSSSSRTSPNGPSRILRSSASPAEVDSSLAPTNASTLAKKFITDFQARSVARRSTKGVRSIELRGGKAQSYSTTTVTSWNVTTTTVETSLSISESTTEKNAESGLAGSALVEQSQNIAVVPKASAADPKAVKEAPTTVKFAKTARSFEEVHAEPETVALKHGEVAERRLSEEYMTNHALEGVVRKISENDRRVKVLVHAFETLATLTDSESLAVEEKALSQHLAHESLSATTISV